MNADGAAGGLVGGNEPMDAGRAYYILNGRRHCQGIHAVWALSDSNSGDGGFSLVPCSHKSNVETPEDVLTGKDDLGLTVQPALKAGDLLLCAATLLQGVRSGTKELPQRLLMYRYAGHAAVQSVGTGPKTRKEEQPEWMAELTPEQRVMLHKPGYRDSDPPPTLSSDGETCRVDPEPRLVPPLHLYQESGFDHRRKGVLFLGPVRSPRPQKRDDAGRPCAGERGDRPVYGTHRG